MKKACPDCGAIHEKGFVCGKKPVYKKFSGTAARSADAFRSSYQWKLKRTHILQRDKYLCVACLNGIGGTGKRFCSTDLSVHHIRPLETNFDLRLCDDNLITLCRNHHEMAEKGEISAEKLLKIIPPRGVKICFGNGKTTKPPL